MKKTLLVLVLLAAFVFPAAAETFTDDLSVGVALGEVLAATAKFPIDDSLSAAVFAGFAVGRDQLYFKGEANYNMTDWQFNIENAEFYPYVGAGVSAFLLGDVAGEAFNMGVNGALGVSYYFDEPFEIFLELGPGITFLNGIDLDYTGHLGFRYAL